MLLRRLGCKDTVASAWLPIGHVLWGTSHHIARTLGLPMEGPREAALRPLPTAVPPWEGPAAPGSPQMRWRRWPARQLQPLEGPEPGHPAKPPQGSEPSEAA